MWRGGVEALVSARSRRAAKGSAVSLLIIAIISHSGIKGSSAKGFLGGLGGGRELRRASELVAVLQGILAKEDEHGAGLLDGSAKVRVACPSVGQCLDAKAVDDVVGRGGGCVHVRVRPQLEYSDLEDHI